MPIAESGVLRLAQAPASIAHPVSCNPMSPSGSSGSDVVAVAAAALGPPLARLFRVLTHLLGSRRPAAENSISPVEEGSRAPPACPSCQPTQGQLCRGPGLGSHHVRGLILGSPAPPAHLRPEAGHSLLRPPAAGRPGPSEMNTFSPPSSLQ
jgi:hypothetical protein